MAGFRSAYFDLICTLAKTTVLNLASPANTKGHPCGVLLCWESLLRNAELHTSQRERVVLREEELNERLSQTQAQISVPKSGHPSQTKGIATRLCLLFS